MMIEGRETIEFPDDILTLRDTLPEIEILSDGQIQRLFKTYAETYCMSWPVLDEVTIEDFRNWCYEEVNEDE